MRTVFTMNDPEFQSPGKQMAYGWGVKRPRTPVTSGQLFRIERGAPFMRAGQLVFATPQFKTQTIYSITNKNAQLTSTATTPGSIIHPFRTK